jgi:hypothetical protein
MCPVMWCASARSRSEPPFWLASRASRFSRLQALSGGYGGSLSTYTTRQQAEFDHIG